MIIYNRSAIEPYRHSTPRNIPEKPLWREFFIDYIPITLLVLAILVRIL